MDKLFSIIFEIWNVIAAMSLYLLFGFLMAGVLHIIMPVSFIEKHLSGKSMMASIKAALIGVPIPLCSCSVIPVAVSLRKKGAGKGAVLSFLTSTPQTGVDSILVTFFMLGWVFTLFRVIIALFSGVICGIVSIWLTGNKNTDNSKISLDEFEDSCCKHKEADNISSENDKSEQCCGDEPENKNKLRQIIDYGFVEMPEDLSKTLIIGLLIAGVLGGLIPEGFFAKFADNQLLSMGIMVAVGIPLYVCSTASVPVAAAFIIAGISPGAALVFLILGPATNAATITTISKTLGKRSMVIYLITISACAVVAGFSLNSLVAVKEVAESIGMHHETIPWYEHVSGIVLLLILINPMVIKLKKKLMKKSS